MNQNACNLTNRRCEPCEGGQPALGLDVINQHLEALHPDWAAQRDSKSIQREFRFKGFNKTMSFVNALAWIANREMHHPDLNVSYDRCYVTLTTHAIDGLSDNDFIVAAKIDQLLV